MKVALIALFLIIGSAIASDYVALKASTYNKDELIKSLRQIGYEYVLQKGIFESTKTPLYNGSWKLNATDSILRRINGSNVYYQFIVRLQSQSSPTLIRARYNITYNKNSGNTLVTYFVYTVLSNNTDGPFISDLPSFIDVRQLSSDDILQEKLDEGVEYAVNEAICEEDLPDSDYRVARVFSIQDTGFSYPYGYRFLVKLANTEGKYYNARITVFNTENIPEEDVDDFPPTYELYPTV
jgi:hypothetical protein